MALFVCLLLIGTMELSTPLLPIIGIVSYPVEIRKLSCSLVDRIITETNETSPDTGLKYPTGFK